MLGTHVSPVAVGGPRRVRLGSKPTATQCHATASALQQPRPWRRAAAAPLGVTRQLQQPFCQRYSTARPRGAVVPAAAVFEEAEALRDDIHVAPPDLPGMQPGGSYDAAANAAYWNTRPVPVVARCLVIAAELARWAEGRGGACVQLSDMRMGVTSERAAVRSRCMHYAHMCACVQEHAPLSSWEMDPTSTRAHACREMRRVASCPARRRIPALPRGRPHRWAVSAKLPGSNERREAALARESLVRLGPAFVKIGQALSSRWAEGLGRGFGGVEGGCDVTRRAAVGWWRMHAGGWRGDDRGLRRRSAVDPLALLQGVAF
jgi:hypothetical protein